MCGRSLGDLYDLYQEMKKAKYADEFGDEVIDPALLVLTEDFQIDISDIFEALCIEKECCRSHLMACVEMKDLY